MKPYEPVEIEIIMLDKVDVIITSCSGTDTPPISPTYSENIVSVK